MENRLAPANVDAGDLPSGFSIADPSGTTVSGEQDSQAQQRQAQKDAILQQALTPDALERLRRIKVKILRLSVRFGWYPCKIGRASDPSFMCPL